MDTKALVEHLEAAGIYLKQERPRLALSHLLDVYEAGVFVEELGGVLRRVDEDLETVPPGLHATVRGLLERARSEVSHPSPTADAARDSLESNFSLSDFFDDANADDDAAAEPPPPQQFHTQPETTPATSAVDHIEEINDEEDLDALDDNFSFGDFGDEIAFESLTFDEEESDALFDDLESVEEEDAQMIASDESSDPTFPEMSFESEGEDMFAKKDALEETSGDDFTSSGMPSFDDFEEVPDFSEELDVDMEADEDVEIDVASMDEDALLAEFGFDDEPPLDQESSDSGQSAQEMGAVEVAPADDVPSLDLDRAEVPDTLHVPDSDAAPTVKPEEIAEFDEDLSDVRSLDARSSEPAVAGSEDRASASAGGADHAREQGHAVGEVEKQEDVSLEELSPPRDSPPQRSSPDSDAWHRLDEDDDPVSDDIGEPISLDDFFEDEDEPEPAASVSQPWFVSGSSSAREDLEQVSYELDDEEPPEIELEEDLDSQRIRGESVTSDDRYMDVPDEPKVEISQEITSEPEKIDDVQGQEEVEEPHVSTSTTPGFDSYDPDVLYAEHASGVTQDEPEPPAPEGDDPSTRPTPSFEQAVDSSPWMTEDPDEASQIDESSVPGQQGGNSFEQDAPTRANASLESMLRFDQEVSKPTQQPPSLSAQASSPPTSEEPSEPQPQSVSDDKSDMDFGLDDSFFDSLDLDMAEEEDASEPSLSVSDIEDDEPPSIEIDLGGGSGDGSFRDSDAHEATAVLDRGGNASEMFRSLLESSRNVEESEGEVAGPSASAHFEQLDEADEDIFEGTHERQTRANPAVSRELVEEDRDQRAVNPFASAKQPDEQEVPEPAEPERLAFGVEDSEPDAFEEGAKEDASSFQDEQPVTGKPAKLFDDEDWSVDPEPSGMPGLDDAYFDESDEEKPEQAPADMHDDKTAIPGVTGGGQAFRAAEGPHPQESNGLSDIKTTSERAAVDARTTSQGPVYDPEDTRSTSHGPAYDPEDARSTSQGPAYDPEDARATSEGPTVASKNTRETAEQPAVGSSGFSFDGFGGDKQEDVSALDAQEDVQTSPRDSEEEEDEAQKPPSLFSDEELAEIEGVGESADEQEEEPYQDESPQQPPSLFSDEELREIEAAGEPSADPVAADEPEPAPQNESPFSFDDSVDEQQEDDDDFDFDLGLNSPNFSAPSHKSSPAAPPEPASEPERAEPSVESVAEEDDDDFDFDLGLSAPNFSSGSRGAPSTPPAPESAPSPAPQADEPSAPAASGSFPKEKTPAGGPEADLLNKLADERANKEKEESSKLSGTMFGMPVEFDDPSKPAPIDEPSAPKEVGDSVSEDEFFALAESLAAENSMAREQRPSYRGEPVMRDTPLPEEPVEDDTPSPFGGSGSVSGAHENPFAHEAPTGVREALVASEDTSQASFVLEEIDSEAEEVADVQETPLERARQLYDSGAFAASREALLEISQEGDAADEAEAERLLEQVEQEMERAQLEALGSLSKTPVLNVPMGVLASLSLDHRSGFLISQIDGMMTFEDILDLSAMSRLETMEVLADLLEREVIAVN